MENTNNLAQRPTDQLVSNLCGTIAAQREQIHALETLAQSRGNDFASMRLVCTQALTALHDEQEAHKKTRMQRDRLVIENRELRSRCSHVNTSEKAA